MEADVRPMLHGTGGVDGDPRLGHDSVNDRQALVGGRHMEEGGCTNGCDDVHSRSSPKDTSMRRFGNGDGASSTGNRRV